MGYLIAAGILIWFGWPLSAFAIGVGIVAYAVRMGPGDQRSQFEIALRKALYETALCILIGLGLVWICQIVFAFRQEDFDNVKRGEASLIHLRERLKWAMGIGPVLIVAGTTLLATLYKPGWRIGPLVAVLRTWVARILLVVSTATSFTFFTAIDIADHEGEWVASRRTEMEGDNAEIARCQRHMAALAAINAAWIASNDKPHEVAAYLKAAAATPRGPDVVRGIAKSLGGDAAHVVESGPIELPGQILVAPLLPATFEPATDDGLDDVAMVAEADRVSERRQRLALALKEGRTQLKELVSKGLENLIPETAKGLIEPFLESLADTIAEKAVDKFYPDSVADLQSAVLWTQLLRRPETWQSWDWRHVDVPAIEHIAPDPLLERRARLIEPMPALLSTMDAIRHQGLVASRSLRTRTAIVDDVHVDDRTDAERIVDQFDQKIAIENREAVAAEEARSARAMANYWAKPEYEREAEIKERLRPRESFHEIP